MNDLKEEKLNEETGIEIPALASKPKKVVMGIVLACFLAYLLINLFLDKPKVENKKTHEEVGEVNIYPTPKLEKNLDGNSKNNVNMSNVLQNNHIVEDEDKKLMLLRQHAPLQMYLAKDAKTISQNNQDNTDVSTPTQNSMWPLNSSNEKNIDNNNVSSSSNDAQTKQVKRLKHQDYLLLEGTIITGILQTAVHSDISGNLKATVQDNIYAAKGKRVLVPKGSIILGHYAGTTSQEQSRIVVVWTRIIRPDDISIQLQAEGTDELGQAGLTGKVNHHFFARFGQASLLSLLGAGIASSTISPNENYTLAVANGFANTSKEALQDSMHVKPTIMIKAGTSIAVYVNQDISFYDVLH